jgi:two-component system chemotaxis response regulator CheB
MAQRILIVDDSPFIHKMLELALGDAPGLEVAGHAFDGESGVRLTAELSPDLVLMDIEMPVMDGLEATRQIMGSVPKPILVFSAAGKRVSGLAFRALEAGAVDLVEKPEADNAADLRACISAVLFPKIRLYAGMQVVRRIRRELIETLGEQGRRLEQRTVAAPSIPSDNVPAASGGPVIAIAASTGGPQTLRQLLPLLPDPLPWPLLLLQHMSQGFYEGFAEWIAQTCHFPVKFMENGMKPLPGNLYIAPGGRHWGVGQAGGFMAVEGEPVFGIRPCADVLFSSLAEIYGDRLIILVLTGMGQDGKLGAEAVRAAGGHVIAQHQDGCPLYGMPKAVIDAGLADAVLRIADIPAHLARHTAIRRPGGVTG